MKHFIEGLATGFGIGSATWITAYLSGVPLEGNYYTGLAIGSFAGYITGARMK